MIIRETHMDTVVPVGPVNLAATSCDGHPSTLIPSTSTTTSPRIKPLASACDPFSNPVDFLYGQGTSNIKMGRAAARRAPSGQVKTRKENNWDFNRRCLSRVFIEGASSDREDVNPP